jgi:3-hydroxybutyryl-CoA dehydratase
MLFKDTTLPTEALPSEAKDLNLLDLFVGYTSSFLWSPKAIDLDNFATISGDKNPLHMNGVYAQGRGFEGRVVHGFLIAAQVSGLIGMLLPGRRCLLMDEKLGFPRPVYLGDKVLISGSVKTIHMELELIELKIKATIDETTVMRGQVTCKLLS